MKNLITAILILSSAISAEAAVESGKTYRIVPDGNKGASLFVNNASKADKTPVVVWTETNVPAQQWTVITLDDGTVALRNVYTGLHGTWMRWMRTTTNITCGRIHPSV